MKRIEFFSLATFLTILCVGLASLDGCGKSDDKLVVIKTKPVWEVTVRSFGFFRIADENGFIHAVAPQRDFDDFNDAEKYIKRNVIGCGFSWGLREKIVRFVEHPYVEVKN